MKIWEKYKEYLFEGEWHVHTNYTDGNCSVLEYSEFANETGIPLIVFTEHVRMELKYNYYEFLNDIKIARRKFPNLIILSGVEAKVLPTGILDCPPEIFEEVDYKLFAFHSFPQSIDQYIFSIKKILLNYDVDAWAHPGLFFQKYKMTKLSDYQLISIFKLMKEKSVKLEFNLKYSLPTMSWIKLFLDITNENAIFFGADVHNKEELYLSWKIKNELLEKFNNLQPNEINRNSFMLWFVEHYPESVGIMREEPEYQERFR